MDVRLLISEFPSSPLLTSSPTADVIERLIHGPDRVYVRPSLPPPALANPPHPQNDISRWKWQDLLSFFNADAVPHRSWLATTRGEFEAILADAEFGRADRCQLLEVRMDRLDGPRALIEQARMVSPFLV